MFECTSPPVVLIHGKFGVGDGNDDDDGVGEGVGVGEGEDEDEGSTVTEILQESDNSSLSVTVKEIV